jgi:hypothetical protein
MQYFAYGSNMCTGRLRVSRPIVQVRLCREAYGAALHESEQHRCKVQEPTNACTKHVPAHWWHSEGVEMSGLASPTTVGMSVANTELVPNSVESAANSLVWYRLRISGADSVAPMHPVDSLPSAVDGSPSGASPECGRTDLFDFNPSPERVHGRLLLPFNRRLEMLRRPD